MFESINWSSNKVNTEWAVVALVTSSILVCVNYWLNIVDTACIPRILHLHTCLYTYVQCWWLQSYISVLFTFLASNENKNSKKTKKNLNYKLLVECNNTGRNTRYSEYIITEETEWIESVSPAVCEQLKIEKSFPWRWSLAESLPSDVKHKPHCFYDSLYGM